MKWVFIVVIIYSYIPSFSQSVLIDSLKVELERVSNEEKRIDILNGLAYTYMFVEINESPKYLALALEESRQLKYKKGEAKSYELRSILYRINGFYEECINDLNRSRLINDSIRNLKGLASNYANLGLTYYELKNFEESINFHQKSFELKHVLGDFHSSLFSINDLCASYIEILEYDSAMKYSNRALELSKSISDTSAMAFVFYNLSKLCLLRGQFDLARLNLDSTIHYCNLASNRFILMKSKLLEAELNMKSQKLDLALENSISSLEIAQEFDFPNDVRDAYECQSKIYEQLGDFKNALKYSIKSREINDSINNIEVERKTAFMAFQNEFDAKQKRIQEEYDSNFFKQRVVIFFIGGLLVVILIVFLIVFIKNRQLQKAYLKLNQVNKNNIRQRNEIQQQKEKIQIQTEKLIHLNAAKDKIFSIVSHDLRGPIENLKGLLHLASNKDISKSDFQEFSTTLEKRVGVTSDILNNLLFWSRSQMGGLNSHFKNFSLSDTAHKKIELFKDMADAKGVELKVEVEKDLWINSDSDLINVVIRNLLSNAIKFTNSGDYISFSAYKSNSSVVLIFKDTGVGISKKNQALLFESLEYYSSQGTEGEKGTGIGLLLVKEVVDILEGDIKVESEEGMGSTFTITIPISE